MKTVGILIFLIALGLVIWKIIQARSEEDAELNSIAKLPASVSNVVAQMDPSQQAAFFAEYQKNKKSLVVAYVAWYLFAVHYFYFRKPGWNILLWACFLFGGLLTFVLIGFPILVLAGIWWIVDLFRMPAIRREYNEGVARQALQTLSLGSSFRPQQPPN
jgi:TM2 domain-containing membrane protein YozV